MRNTLLILAFLLAHAAFTQEIMMNNYHHEDELPSNEIFHIMQDSQGYIWIGTNLGVSNFDEYSFEKFDANDRVLAIGILLLFVTVVIFLVIRNRKIKTKAEQSIIKYQQLALSNQMNPHFLYNSLNSIHRYLLENNPIYASKYLARFAKLMRLFLDNSNHEFISLNKEIEMIEIYLELEKLRMKDAFSYNINMNHKIDTDATQIPAMIIQPLVENAIMHGIRYLQNKKGYIKISFHPEQEFLNITIEDNGVGMTKAQELEQSNKHISNGSIIVKKRLDLLNQLYDYNILLNFIDLQDEGSPSGGTKIIIRNIPIDVRNAKNRDN